VKLIWAAEDLLLRHVTKVAMTLLERKMSRGLVRVSVADAVAELSGMHADSPTWMAIRGGMIDHLQRGWVEPWRSPEGELRFRLTAKGKAYAEGFRSRRDEVIM
jgi:hypothetical protein